MWCVDVAAIPSPFSLSRSRRIRGVRGVRGVERKQSLNLNKALPFIIIISHSSRRHTMTITTLLRCQTPDEHFHSNNNQPPQPQEQSSTEDIGFWGKWMAHSAEMRAKLAKLGLAAVLAYGLFDGVTYTTFFVLAFLGYEKSTGKNPAANLQALLGIVLLMWTGNNVTRPFRVAGAAALAPAIDKVLKSIQEKLNLPRVVYAFALVVGIFASACLSVAGLLILSRWGK